MSKIQTSPHVIKCEIASILCSISRGVRTRPLLQAAGGRLVLMATRVCSTRGLVPIRSTVTLGCPAALLRAPDTRTRPSRRQGRPCGRRGQVGALHTLGSTHPGRRGQMGARDTTEATATTGQSHSTRGEALATSSSDIDVDLWRLYVRFVISMWIFDMCGLQYVSSVIYMWICDMWLCM